MKKLGLFTLSLLFISMPALADYNSDKHAVDSSSYETVTRMNVDRSGKPPYKRTIETVRVTDIAALEMDKSKATDHKARPAFNYKLNH